ncbi:MAG TPA: FAD-dependent oxidoreductase [Sulfurovum sp.]|jgi:sulfide:quinone oxidoreductase|nr:MAG: sulfide:quinone reductase [Sulfurovum sp. 35-42-20]OYZ26406.1 MAG: sulfide:quinone reductase [Sulfurovum sp. 16-42-52]OYZ49799.1 MAG: sulfide:quinone reductase [Sulfurovum sp. 24-42-9]OZA46392.1 MAG: sulfide:quinone reductase [Sulfurovum sp. 17-42-90]OZA60160.1 MAG: sulfide:quinone reductase [Sulfurovum sp. 39-42-12]HQR73767.1 FAD-dependent oxidoreductase [Sulfurovum sp.]
MKKVLVLGGGFAGVEASIYLRKQGLDVTLVSDRDYFYIYPTSIWIPTGKVTKKDVSVPLDALAMKHGFELIVDAVVKLEAKEKKVALQSGRVLDDFGYIVIAMGQDKLRHKGMEHTLSICGKPEEATLLYDRLDALVQKGSGKIAMGFGGNPKDTSAVRGGPAFEVLFNVDTYLKDKGVRENFELTFFAPMQKPGQKMGEKALVMMDKMFTMSQIDKKVGSSITQFEADGISFEDGTTLASDLTMFISAGTGHSVLADSGLPLSSAGFVVTTVYNEIEGFEGIYAIGDSASLMGPEWRAKQGHVAEVMAKNVAYNIFNAIQNIDSKRSYINHLNILCMMDTGNGAALVYRNDKGGTIIPLPVIGHWLKKGWGWYCRHSKLGHIPRIPGM